MPKSFIDKYRPLVDLEIESYFNRLQGKYSKISQEASEFLSELKKYCLRPGKRLRPLFVIAGYKCFSSDNEEDLIRVSATIELLHAFLLIHD